MNLLRNRLLGTLTVTVMAVGLAACGGSASGGDGVAVAGPWKDVVAAAEKEGLVNVYSSMPKSQNDPLVAAFREAYPNINVELTRGAGELPARVEQEISSGADGGDVFIHTNVGWFPDHAADFLTVDGPATSGWSADAWMAPNKSIVVGSFPITMIAWNTNIFPKGFKSWNDLLDPSVKGKLGVGEPLSSSIAGLYGFMEDELGAEYAADLGANEAKLYNSTEPMTQALGAGEIGVSIASTPSTITSLKQAGAPVDAVVPDPSYWLQIAGAALNKSPRPNAARVFLDFAMSAEGQKAINGNGFGVAGRDGVPGALDRGENATVMDYKRWTSAAVTEMNQKFRKWFG